MQSDAYSDRITVTGGGCPDPGTKYHHPQPQPQQPDPGSDPGTIQQHQPQPHPPSLRHSSMQWVNLTSGMDLHSDSLLGLTKRKDVTYLWKTGKQKKRKYFNIKYIFVAF